ncbi:DNA-binding protein [Apibacter muscae]|uniref:helix-turn-helix domain-containing protein n=1 Tax=Apibacter muscae TaxID=2509004 RepID=UPI0011ADF186|nr:helix-turn-helix domain-containing protein [Apibacter muscae]TWP31797.1 DNA-binding protein [Apibacter muscae]
MVHPQIFISLTQEELQILIKEAVQTALKQQPLNTATQPSPEKYYTRKQTAEKLHISLGTLDNYTQTGLLTAYKIGHRILYKPQDINHCLNQKQGIPTNKRKQRKQLQASDKNPNP